MTLKLDLVGIIVKDMPKALAFYRSLGLAIPPEMDKEGHVEITLETGLRLAWDTHDMIRSFDADWHPPHHHMESAWRFCARVRLMWIRPTSDWSKPGMKATTIRLTPSGDSVTHRLLTQMATWLTCLHPWHEADI